MRPGICAQPILTQSVSFDRKYMCAGGKLHENVPTAIEMKLRYFSQKNIFRIFPPAPPAASLGFQGFYGL